MSYEYSPEERQVRFDTDVNAKKMAMAQQDIRATLTGVIAGAGRTLGPEVMKEPNISVNIERMDKILAYQEELLTMLEQRMTPFIRPYPKQSSEEGAKTASCQSALSERLYVQTKRADFLCARMNILIESIDL